MSKKRQLISYKQGVRPSCIVSTVTVYTELIIVALICVLFSCLMRFSFNNLVSPCEISGAQ
jgi:hypothetical protein